MRIAFLVGVFPRLSETFILNQVTGLLDRGHEVDLYAERAGEETCVHPDVERYDLLRRTRYVRLPASPMARVIESPRALLASGPRGRAALYRTLDARKYGMPAASLRLFYTALPFLCRRPYDVIHCHFGMVGLGGAMLRDAGAICGKLVTTFHAADLTVDPERFGPALYKRLFAAGDLFLPVSKRWEERLVRMGCDPARVRVHRMGVACRAFSFARSGSNSGGPVRITTVARLVEKKGVKYGIRAVAGLARAGRRIEYRVVGDGILRAELERLIHALDAAEWVRLLGWREQPEVREILRDTDIFLAPSVTARNGDQEGIPVSLMEAMAAGLPVVSTRHSGIPELVEDGVSGFLAPERDADALAGRLERLIEDPRLRREMGCRGRAFVDQHHDVDRLNDRLVEVYSELLSGQWRGPTARA
jgi:colanic acid/amylovoran/stewartan biosynthesis glycosyltransferase WcaL/AmsK/CpsK